ncbi:hypothetical protein PIB30_035612 [Stylosanthes scabra]|uniref:Uncharacterized protein n=1 Tax=Stylosanthes scabra TaxID=79078 RepID=A0ABU6XDB2_9FABA|nr:hypothetical protein [Stylosanthes scabra]
MRPVAPRPPRPAGSLSSSVSFGTSGSFHRESERAPHTSLPPPALMPVPGPVHRPAYSDDGCTMILQLVCTDDEPSDYEGDVDADEIGDLEEPYAFSDSTLSSRDVSSAGASFGSEHESASLSFGPSSHFSSYSSSGSGSVGYGSVTSGSASDASSDDDLVNCHFAGTFPPP